MRKSDSSVYSRANLKFAGTLFFNLDSCVMSHVQLFAVSFGSFRPLVSVVSELKAALTLLPGVSG